MQMSQATKIVTSVLRSVRLPSPASPLVTMSSGRRILAMAQLDLLPVRRRARSSNRTGGNRLSGYLCELPVGEPDPGKRPLAIRRAMEQNKSTGADSGPGAIPVLADQLPPAVHRVVASVAGQGASLLFDLVVTSIPVPSIPFTLDGAELEEVFPIAPLAAGQALVVGLPGIRTPHTSPCTPTGRPSLTCADSPRRCSPRWLLSTLSLREPIA